MGFVPEDPALFATASISETGSPTAYPRAPLSFLESPLESPLESGAETDCRTPTQELGEAMGDELPMSSPMGWGRDWGMSWVMSSPTSSPMSWGGTGGGGPPWGRIRGCRVESAVWSENRLENECSYKDTYLRTRPAFFTSEMGSRLRKIRSKRADSGGSRGSNGVSRQARHRSRTDGLAVWTEPAESGTGGARPAVRD